MKIINFKEKKMKFLTVEQQKSYENTEICYICQESLKINLLTIKDIIKLEMMIIMLVNTEVLQIVHAI